MITGETLKEFSFNTENGFLIKYHFNQGIDIGLLDDLYEMLEILEKDWESKKDVPKDILYYLMTIIPTLYRDITLYSKKEDQHDVYEELIFKLDLAISMCLNPDTNDVHFNIPLKDLG
jgi:hypothetical protein